MIRRLRFRLTGRNRFTKVSCRCRMISRLSELRLSMKYERVSSWVHCKAKPFRKLSSAPRLVKRFDWEHVNRWMVPRRLSKPLAMVLRLVFMVRLRPVMPVSHLMVWRLTRVSSYNGLALIARLAAGIWSRSRRWRV